MILHKYHRLFGIGCIAALLALLLSWPAGSAAQHEPISPDATFWSGIWETEADGMRFSVRIKSEGDFFELEEIAPLGLGWQANNGVISGSSATVDVMFQGVSATVLIQALYPDTAIVRPLSCQPDYHLLCTLVRNQQARFQRRD